MKGKNTRSVVLNRGTRTPWGYEEPKLGYAAPKFSGMHALKI